jgi:hypothetical protein
MRFGFVAVVFLGCAVGCTKNQSTPAAKENDKNPLPLRVAKDGWYLTEDCVLNLDSSPYVREAEGGKVLFASSVTVTPTGRNDIWFKIRPTDKSPTDSINNQALPRPIIKLNADLIPLPKSMGMESEGRLMLAGGKDGNVLGGQVVTKVVKKETKIMPAQNAEVVDSQGTVVLRVPQ